MIKGGRKAQGQRGKVRHFRPRCEAKMPEPRQRAGPGRRGWDGGRAGTPGSRALPPLAKAIHSSKCEFRVPEGKQKGEAKGNGRKVKDTATARTPEGKTALNEMWPSQQCHMYRGSY